MVPPPLPHVPVVDEGGACMDGMETRVRLMEMAGQVFAECGFREATVRDICHRAGANVAAVNYHFGSKEGLYSALLEYSFLQAAEQYPLRPTPGAPANEKLATFVETTLSRMLDEGKRAWHGKLMIREMTEPTGALDSIAERFMKPHFAAMCEILRELLGPAVPDRRLTLLALSTMGQMVFYKMGKHAVCRVAPQIGHSDVERKELGRHITGVILAAAAEIKKEYEASQSGGCPEGAGL